MFDDILKRLNRAVDFRIGYCRCGCDGRTKAGKQKGTVRDYLNGHATRKLSAVRVDPTTDCWLWLKSLHTNGYGVAYSDDGNHERKQAHRMVWEWVYGDIPIGFELDHLCRNRACVNPTHIRLATRAENTQCGLIAKLNPNEVQRIRHLRKQGLSERRIAGMVGVSRGTISGVVRNQTWKNVG